MAPFWPAEIFVNLWLQNLGTSLAPIMQFFSFFGQVEFYIILLPLLYWCVDARLALQITSLLTFSGCSNSLLKITFHGARPYWFDPRIKAISSESSFGIPSGHAQNAVVIWGFLATKFQKKWTVFLFYGLILLISLSRLYLGVHFLSDILCGWFIGGIILFLFLKFEKPFLNWFNRFPLYQKTYFLFLFTVILFGSGLIWSAVQSQVPVPNDWLLNAKANPSAVPVSPYSPNDIVTFSGVFFGISAGYVWLNDKMTYKPGQGSFIQKTLRFLIGLIGVLIIVYGLGFVLPGGVDLLASMMRYVRFALTGVWVSAFCPLLFKKMHLL